MSKEPTTKPTNIRFDVELYDQVRAIAEDEGRTVTSQLHRIVREWIAEHPHPALKKKGGRS